MSDLLSRRGFSKAVGAALILPSLPGSLALAQRMPIKMGLLLTYSGQFADPAAQIDNGIRLYKKQHGDTVAGRSIEILRRDVGGLAPAEAKRVALELVIRDQVDVLAGFVLSPNALAVADVSEDAKKFMVVMNAAASIVTTMSPFMARVSFTVPQNCELLGTWASQNGVRRLYTMVSDYGPGHDAEDALHRSFKDAGGEVVGSVRMPLTNHDFSAFVQRAKDVTPDGIFVFVPGGTQPGAIAKSLVERGLDARKIKLLGQGELSDESALKVMGDAAVGIITAFHYDYHHNSALNKQFVAEYNNEFQRNPDFYSVGGYDGMHLIYEALKKTGGNADAGALIEASKGMRWESPRGAVSIDPETRDMINTVYIRRVEKIEGQLRNVEIARFANVKDPVKSRT